VSPCRAVQLPALQPGAPPSRLHSGVHFLVEEGQMLPAVQSWEYWQVEPAAPLAVVKQTLVPE